jgi:transposase
MTTSYVGVDIAKAKFDAALRDQKGKYHHKKFDNNLEGFAAFLAWLDSFGDAKSWVCMEATGAYSIPLAEFLVGQGFRVSVVNPARLHAFAKSELSRAKTDKIDAKLITLWASRQGEDLPIWNPPPPNIRELQALLRRAEDLLEMQQMERNRLDTASPVVADSIKTHLETLEKELASIREAVRRRIDDDPDLKRRSNLLETIPGIGPASSAWLLVSLSDHYGFTNAKQAAAHAGLAPRLRESGTWKGKTRLSKTGDPLLRKALYMPAMSASVHNPAIRAFCQRLRANGKNGLAVMCAAMRKIIHLAFAILKSGKPFDRNLSLA